MNKILLLVLALSFFISCNNDVINSSVAENEIEVEEIPFLSAVDISTFPEIANSNPTFYDFDGHEKHFLDILQENGINTIRLKLWVNPSNEHSGYNEVKAFSDNLKSRGFKTWLTLHYSDTWADPGQQIPPLEWQELSFEQLKDRVFTYTQKVVEELQPDYLQIGNEINSGFLHPYGNISTNIENFKELLNAGISAVRANTTDTEIILHFAGIERSEWFFNQVKTLDYDIIGLSYYPIWHGKSIGDLKTKMQYLGDMHSKKILIAETAYPFTLEWNDWTNNIVGLDEQLILPAFPATPEGQQNFVNEIRSLINELENGLGFCYWGAELVAWKDNQATDASPWENQALFDFENKALPVLRAFKNE